MIIDWPALRAAAAGVAGRAYAPYSRLRVGAAGLTADGRVVTGCNVENAAYGVVLCAECGVVSALHASGGGRLVALACVDAAGDALMPCGRCRQLLWEHGGAACLIDAPDRPRSMAELLPFAFDVSDLAEVTGAGGLNDPASRQVGHATVHPSVEGEEIPVRLQEWVGRGTVFVHQDSDGGQPVWTAYWERSSGADGEEAGILEEGPYWSDAAGAVGWGRARTPRVVVVQADGELAWAGVGPAPAEVGVAWPE